MSVLHVWPQEPYCRDSKETRAARLELADKSSSTLWYEFPVEYSASLTDSADPYLIAAILTAMRHSADIQVHGAVSSSLIENLYEFQSAWHCWLPDKYFPVEIRADHEETAVLREGLSRSIAAFTGGIDSCFTMLRHKRLPGNHARKNIEAGLFVHGFDIPLEQANDFARAAARASQTLASLDVPLLTMASNHKELNPEWDETHGIGIASCLAFFQRRFREGIIASTYSYSNLSLPWGSNPVTDHLLSSQSFRLVHDAAGIPRGQKLRSIQQWTDGYENLRVCFSCNEKDKNCGKCSKCITTLLFMNRFKLPIPSSFPNPDIKQALLGLRDLSGAELSALEIFIEQSKQRPVDAEYMDALERCTRYNRYRNSFLPPRSNWIGEQIRKLRLNFHERQGP